MRRYQNADGSLTAKGRVKNAKGRVKNAKGRVESNIDAIKKKRALTLSTLSKKVLARAEEYVVRSRDTVLSDISITYATASDRIRADRDKNYI